ncbi:hypothetical protein LJR231_003612 [Phyllobacterium sp. LjRoot231]|uniref:hypothetical protein n=1 Tax=Phyllobacterium sp. LjRoot231 TaxID=3342289 RepID=UPI003ECD6C0F
MKHTIAIVVFSILLSGSLMTGSWASGLGTFASAQKRYLVHKEHSHQGPTFQHGGEHYRSDIGKNFPGWENNIWEDQVWSDFT